MMIALTGSHRGGPGLRTADCGLPKDAAGKLSAFLETVLAYV